MCHRFWIIAKMIKDFLFLTWELTHAFHQTLINFFLGNFNLVIRTYFSKDKPCANSALGNLTILRPQFILSLVQLVNFLTLIFEFTFKLMPYLIEFQIHHTVW